MSLIIDLDNTLYDYNYCNEIAFIEVSKYVYSEFSINEDLFNNELNEVRQVLHSKLGTIASSHHKNIQIKKVLESLGIFSLKHYMNLVEIYEHYFISKLDLYSGVQEFLMNYQGKICILTDYILDFQIEKIKQLGLFEFVDFVVTSEEVGADKPSPLMFNEALKLLNCSPEKAIMIGDDFEKDIMGANFCGIRAIHFSSRGVSNYSLNSFSNYKLLKL